MIRQVNEIKFLYLCQSSDWQLIVESDCEENAATIAIENIMLLDDEKEKYCLSNTVAVKKIHPNLFQDIDETDIHVFYSPMILANAGFHAEAKMLEQMIEKDKNGDI